MRLCHICGGVGTEEERVRMPAGPWKVSDLDIIVDPLVSTSDTREGPEAPTGSDCTSCECSGYKRNYPIRKHRIFFLNAIVNGSLALSYQ